MENAFSGRHVTRGYCFSKQKTYFLITVFQSVTSTQNTRETADDRAYILCSSYRLENIFQKQKNFVQQVTTRGGYFLEKHYMCFQSATS